ncbi:hypothetical protein LTR86_006052 [Recurvomyces mirabilis]|nr:hypothetical protein LTR86_006052 [Recurvomyces mirabilis]
MFGHTAGSPGHKATTSSTILHQQEVVLHACLAVSSMHRAHTLQRPQAEFASPDQLGRLGYHERKALESYTNAVSSLHTLIHQSNYQLDTSTVQIVLLVCLLCVHFSLLRGSEDEAFTHLDKGLAVIFGLSRPYAPTRGKRFRPLTLSTTPTTKPLEILLQEFVRLDGEFAAYATRQPYLSPELEPDYSGDVGPGRMRFSSLAEASIVLGTVSSSVARHHGALLRYTTSQVDDLSISFQDEAHRDAYIRAASRGIEHAMLTSAQERTSQALSAWSSALEALACDEYNSLTYLRLRLQFFDTWFVNSSYNNTHECITDTFETTFKQVVEIAEKYLTAHTVEDERVPFDPSPAAIPALFLVGMKYRTSSIRGKAIALLRNTTLQEGLWHGPPLAAFAEQVARIEELQARKLNPFLSDVGVETGELECGDVPEAARLSDVVFVLDDEGADQRGRRLVCARSRDYDGGGAGSIGERLIVKQYQLKTFQ